MEGSLPLGSLLVLITALFVGSSALKSVYHAHARVNRLVGVALAALLSAFFGERIYLAQRAGALSALLFGQYFCAGGICAFLTHAACTPIDVVKTRMQTMPGKYTGMTDGFRRIASEEGYATLLKGLGATAVGFFLHGSFKYSFYEVFKTILSADADAALKPGFAVASSAGFLAECIACVLLCPMEAVRIRSVADSAFPSGVFPGLRVILRLEGLHGLYKGLPAMLLKQVPYTVGQFVSFELSLAMVKSIVNFLFHRQYAGAVSLTAGFLAGVSAAVISHPGDTILSKINQEQSDGTAYTQIVRVAKSEGFFGLFLGLLPRLLQVMFMVGGQFAIYDTIKQWCGIQVAAAIPEAVATAVVGAAAGKLTPVKVE